jgi:hypothetical protein
MPELLLCEVKSNHEMKERKGEERWRATMDEEGDLSLKILF